MSFVSLGPLNPVTASGDYYAFANQAIMMTGANKVYLPVMPQNGAEVNVIALTAQTQVLTQGSETLTVGNQTNLTSWPVNAGTDCTFKYMRGSQSWYRTDTSDVSSAPEVFTGPSTPPGSQVLWIDTDEVAPVAGGLTLVNLSGPTAYSAQPGDAIVVDYPYSAVVITLPKKPVANTMIRVVAMGAGGASLKAQNPDLLMDDLENSGTWALGKGSSVILIYDASSQAWWPIDHGLSRLQLAADRYQKITRTSNAAGANDYATASTTAVAIDSTNLRITKTCQNRPIRLHLRGCGVISSVALASVIFSFRMDGAVIDGGIQLYQYAAVASQQYAINLAWDVAPQTGSHYFEPWWQGNNASGGPNMYARSNLPMQFTWEELPYGP